MARNRMYPLGSAIGFLMDYLHISWKPTAQQAGQQFTFQKVLADALGLRENRPDELVEMAKDAYDYTRVLAATEKIIAEYHEAFKKECTTFEAQSGYRIQIDFTARSLSRSRASRGKKWLVEEGTQSLCSNYEVYTLKNNDLLLQIQNSAVREYSAGTPRNTQPSSLLLQCRVFLWTAATSLLLMSVRSPFSMSSYLAQTSSLNPHNPGR
jgi:hypothetical protein